MVIPMEYTHTGYDYLDRVDSLTPQWHSGVDLNFGRPYEDLGKTVKATASGVVVFAEDTGKGWGNLVVIYHKKYKVWSRYGHLQNFIVKEGQTVLEGQPIGGCGGTGGEWAPHLHFDIILEMLTKWTAYTSWWSMDKVRQYYADPLKFIEEANKMEAPTPNIVDWHIEHQIIEQWEEVPPEWKSTVAWAIYKMGKSIINGELNKDDFYL